MKVFYEKLTEVSKHPKGYFRARKTPQKFGIARWTTWERFFGPRPSP